MPMEIQPGRAVRPIKPLLSWELLPGITLTLPAELEAILIQEGFVVQIGSAANMQIEGN